MHTEPSAIGVAAFASLLALSGCASGAPHERAVHLRSNGHLMQAGNNASRAGFSGGMMFAAEDDEKVVSLPAVQGFAGTDFGSLYSLHTIVSSNGIWLDGALIPVNRPGLRLGIAHGIGGSYERDEFASQFRGGAGGGPYVAVGSDIPVLLAFRYDALNHWEKLHGGLAHYVDPDKFGPTHTLSGSAAIHLPESPLTPLEIVLARNVGSRRAVDVTVLMVAITISAEVPR